MATSRKVSDKQFAESKHQYTDPRTGERVIGVTSVVGCLDTGDKLGAGAAAAVKLVREGIDYRKKWNEASDRGKRVHAYAQLWAEGKAAEVPDEDGPYMDAFEKFCVDYEPHFIEVERAVVHSAGYGGRFDLVAELASTYALVDIKTGKPYKAELTLQQAGYRYADGMVIWGPDGNALALEPMPHIDAAAGLYLHDDGTYDLVWVDADEAAHAHFLNLLAIKQWAKAASK